jgi:chromosome segregation ATPase
MDAVAELTARIAELGERINQLNDDIPEQADRIDSIRDEATVLAYEQQGLTERIDQIDLTVEEERERLDGALEQDIITSSILADAEARLTAEVADLQLRLDKIDDEPPRRDDEDD